MLLYLSPPETRSLTLVLHFLFPLIESGVCFLPPAVSNKLLCLCVVEEHIILLTPP